jgi:hypothetical protein
MKKIVLAAGAIFIPAMAIFAQDYNRTYAAEGDPSIKSQFTVDFPDAKDVHFAHVKNLNEVSFTENKAEMIAYYREGDELVGSIRKESAAGLPENAQKKIQHKYPGYTIANVVKFDDNESEVTDMILYGRAMDDADNFFVELKNESGAIVVKVDLSGGVDYFTALK